MAENISQKSDALKQGVENPLETYSVDTEQIKAQEQQKQTEESGSENKEINISPDAGTDAEKIDFKKDSKGNIDVKADEVFSPFRTYSIDTEQIRAQEQAQLQEQKKENAPEKNLLETYSVDTEQIKAQEIKERAEKELPQILKGINEARNKGQKEAENSFYALAPEVYKEATGEELSPKVDEMAAENFKETGMKVMKIRDYLSPERVKNHQDEVRREERSSAILKSWEQLNSDERQKYTQNGVIDSEKFVEDLTAQKRALVQKESITEDVFNRMTNEGLDVKSIKKRGFFGQMFGGAAVEVPTLDGSGVLSFSSKKKFKEYLTKKEFYAKDFMEKEAKRRMDKKIIEGQARLRQEKQRCVRKIFQETVEKKEQATRIAEEQRIEAERQAKIEQEKVKPKIEIVSRIDREGTPEQMREMEKMRKKVESDIKRRKELKEKVMDLIKKQNKGRLLTQREVAYLRAVELGQKKEREAQEAT